mgnify:CR=1 FL=1|tara:strand:+ start:31366 stop:32076 length:711 start_codon:yes stop_codon:yes gene_type:complete
MYLSVVIPAYNEEKRIGSSLTRVYEYLKKRDFDFEIIVIDDGSKDKTLNLLTEYSQKNPNLIVLKNENNQGKGFSVKKGILKSKGNIILFTDADLSTPIEEIDKLINYLKEGYQIAIGSRALPESRIEIYQVWYRQLMGKAFNKIIRIILNLDYYDTQCGFKCFQRTAALEIFKSMKISGFSFDIEVLFIANHRGLKIKEVPVRWYNSPESKVKVVRDSSRMLWDILKLRFNNFKD